MENQNIKKKREEEKKSLEAMVRIYCKGNHQEEFRKYHDLCPTCRELLTYASMRTDRCPYMETKTFCSACKVHCYQPKKREQVRQVMRYAGPRMMFVNPLLAYKHVLTTIKTKMAKKEEV